MKERNNIIEKKEKEPYLNDVKWKIFNKRIIEYSSQKQWGLYRNNKLDMANLLEKERKIKQALSTLFEICYLDLNGCRNVGIFDGKLPSKEMMEELGIKEFDLEVAFLAPGIISMVEDLISQLNISGAEAKKLFIDINNKTKPLKNMPVTPESAWKKLSEKIS